MSDFIEWPTGVLPPTRIAFDPRPFSRSGGRSLSGIARSTKSDRGYWVGRFSSVIFRRNDFGAQRVWNTVRTSLSGTTGLVVVPVCSTRLLVGMGATEFFPTVPFDDEMSFDDDTEFLQSGVVVEMAEPAAIGATVVTLRNIVGASSLSGIRFSYRHALYETGAPISVSGNEWTVPLSTAIRRAIPEDVRLEVEQPTCLCHLATDDQMDIDFGAGSMPRPNIEFVEAVDYWNDLALEEAA